jgi:hypothetical protein
MLTGTTAQRLFDALSSADRLLAELRAGTDAAAATPVPSAQAPVPATASAPLRAPVAPTRTRGLRAASVPRILLGLGALCLLVAALVFLAVTWSVLGVGGRTATLVGLTTVAGGLGGWFLRRRLQAAGESLALVGYGLLVLDILGADQAGWWGNPSPAALLALLGTTLVVTGAGAALAVRRTLGADRRSGEVVAAIGAALLAVAWGTATWLPVAPSLVIATVLCAALVVGAHRAALGLAFINTGAVTAAAWVALTALGLDRVLEASTWRVLLGGARWWPLVVAAALVGALAVVRRVPTVARITAVGLAQLLVVVALLAPARELDPTSATLVALGLLLGAGVLTAVLTRLAPSPWRLCSLGTQALAGLGVLAAASSITLVAAVRLGHAVEDPWSGSVSDSLAGPSSLLQLAPWLLPICLLALLGTAWVLLGRRAVAATDARTAGEAFTALVAAGTIAAVADYPVPVWLLLALLLLVSVVSLAQWFVVRSAVALGSSALFAAAAVTLSLHATGLTEIAAGGVLLLALLVQLVTERPAVAATSAAVTAAALAGVAWTTGVLLDVPGRQAGLATLALLAAVVLLTPYLPRWWWASDIRTVRAAGEAAAAVVAVPVAVAALDAGPTATLATWLAVYLTLAGVAVTVMSLLRTDRRSVAWVGGLLLALASWVRLWDIGVHAPEAYTLPSAVVLLLVGLRTLRRRREATTTGTLAPGLALALVPSLLWVLVEEPGPRALLLGLACLGLVALGVRLGWTAPLVAGASVGALLVLRLAGPYVGTAVPRWILIGLAGALLVARGATWERRLQEARQLAGYVRGLR